jgi:DNA-binding response OmpR family regulator
MRKTIAVCDDDKPIVDVMTLILKDEGFDVRSYEDGEKLLSDIEKEDVHLVLLDYRLPRKNGMEVAKTLKKKTKAKDIPVIMISANHNLESSIDKNAVDDFIPKPFDISHLMEKVYRYL